jgi:hypothetical protein
MSIAQSRRARHLRRGHCLTDRSLGRAADRGRSCRQQGAVRLPVRISGKELRRPRTTFRAGMEAAIIERERANPALPKPLAIERGAIRSIRGWTLVEQSEYRLAQGGHPRVCLSATSAPRPPESTSRDRGPSRSFARGIQPSQTDPRDSSRDTSISRFRAMRAQAFHVSVMAAPALFL